MQGSAGCAGWCVMAMTKKERETMQAAIDRADLLAALRWTNPVVRDVPPPKDGYTEGWDFNVYSESVYQAWSGCVVNGRGLAPKGQRQSSASQGARTLYSTEARALAAMRHEIELETARNLMQIDRKISEQARGGG
jgi:hypothetical protein